VTEHLWGEELADRVLMEMQKAAQQKLMVLVAEEGRSYGVVFVEETKGEAFPGHLKRRHSDVSNVLAHPPEARLGHNFVVEYSMEVRMVFVDARYMKAWYSEDERREETAVVGSQTEGKGYGHREKQYSAKRDAAAVVLDP